MFEFVEDEQGSEGGGGLITPNLTSTSLGLNGKIPVDLKALSIFLLLSA